jgi:hypothetical protein
MNQKLKELSFVRESERKPSARTQGAKFLFAQVVFMQPLRRRVDHVDDGILALAVPDAVQRVI